MNFIINNYVGSEKLSDEQLNKIIVDNEIINKIISGVNKRNENAVKSEKNINI